MGTSYGVGPSGRWVLSCDECGHSDGTVRTVRCPYGYCYRAHLWRTCRAIGSPLAVRLGFPSWGSKEYHRSRQCDVFMARSNARRQLERDQSAAGTYFLHSAMSSDVKDPATGEGVVQVVLGAGPWGEASPGRWVLMRTPMYRAVQEAVGRDRTPTLEDFRAAGPVYAGPVGFARDPAATAAVADAWRTAADPAAAAPVVDGPPPTKELALVPVGGSA